MHSTYTIRISKCCKPASEGRRTTVQISLRSELHASRPGQCPRPLSHIQRSAHSWWLGVALAGAIALAGIVGRTHCLGAASGPERVDPRYRVRHRGRQYVLSGHCGAHGGRCGFLEEHAAACRDHSVRSPHHVPTDCGGRLGGRRHRCFDRRTDLRDCGATRHARIWARPADLDADRCRQRAVRRGRGDGDRAGGSRAGAQGVGGGRHRGRVRNTRHVRLPAALSVSRHVRTRVWRVHGLDHS